MVHTFSIELPMGIEAPEFKLTDVVNNQLVSLKDIQSEIATVIMFICNHCPYVKHYNTEISKLAEEYQKKGISFVAISANDADNFPDDGPEFLKQQALQFNFTFPYLYDATQMTAKAYKAACTPDFFVFDEELKLIYHGQLDDSRPKNALPVTGKDLREVLELKLKGQPLKMQQTPSSGCNIKWKAGVSPF